MLSLFFLPLLAQDSPVAGLAMADLIETLPACAPQRAESPTLDLEASCVDGACAGMRVDEVTEQLGDPTCRPGSDAITRDSTFCDWPGGINAHYRTEEEEHLSSLFVMDPAHRTASGLGVGSSLGCFIEAYGDGARSVEVQVKDGRLYLTSLRLREPNFTVSANLEGVVTRIQLNGR